MANVFKNPLLLFSAIKGLNTRTRPKNLHANDGVVELAEAVNVDVVEGYAVQRRCGYTSVADGTFHSLFRSGDNCYVVMNDTLVHFTKDNPSAFTSIAYVGKSPLYYAEIGGLVYYSNLSVRGVLDGVASTPWVASTYVGPTTPRSFSLPENGRYLCYYNGVLYYAVGSVVFHSEPLAPMLFDLSANFIPFPCEVVAIWRTQGALFVSTTEKIYMYLGGSPRAFEQVEVLNGRAFHNSVVMVDAYEDRPSGAFVATEKGICFTSANGAQNLTETTVSVPRSADCSAFYRGFRYVCSFI